MSERLVSRSGGGRRVARLIAFLAVGAVAALGASPASAFLFRLKNGKELSYEALAGARAPQSARIFDAAFSNLDYSGGPVMPSNTNHTIVWNPSNYTGTPFQSGYTAGVNRFLSDVGADSGTTSNSYSVASQYNDANGNIAAYSSTFGGTLTDSNPLPAGACGSGAHPCVTDAQIQAELDSFLAAHQLPRDLTHEYFLLTPPGVVSCFDSDPASTCSAQSPVNPGFCAYHSVSSTSSSFLYVNIPDLAGVPGCDPFVTFCPNTSCAYDNGPWDGVLNAVSHEQIESNTDPRPNSAWTDWQVCGSISPPTCGGEIGDKCDNDGFSDPNVQLQDNGSGTDTPYNDVINGTHYLIQMEWSNQTARCLHSFTSNGTAVTASYTTSQSPPDTINFDASGSTPAGGVAEYVWQFNDGPGQTFTTETASPMISHVFAAPGGYDVALTVMANDGTSNGTAKTVIVGPLLNPTAAFSVSPASALEGTTFSFDGSTSSDPNPGASITYSWDFGDGSPAGGGPAPTHVFTAGIYTVTLAVTDNFGKSSSTQRTLTVTDEMPSTSFNPPSGVAGTPVAFSGSGSDPDGTITAYNWTFGDGGAGSGASPSHAYSAPGTYAAVLTVTDSTGQAASVSHLVSIRAALPPPPPPNCTVPNVIGESLAAASKAIKSAHCAVGKVSGPGKKPKRRPGKLKAWAAVVSRENPSPRSKRSKGTKVKLTLVWKAARK